MTEDLASPRTISPSRRDRVVPCQADDEARSIALCVSTRGCAATSGAGRSDLARRGRARGGATVARRDFLRIGGIAGAGAVLAACDRGASSEPDTSPQPSNPRGDGRDLPRVAIVGAGLSAGMTAAYRLHQAGIRPLVFEARDRVGGRCWSARDWAGGQVGEHGGEFVDTRHVHMRVLVGELGLELDDLWSAWVPGSTWLTYVDGEIVRARDEFRLMAPAVDEIVALAAEGPLAAGASPPEIAAFDEMTAARVVHGRCRGPIHGALSPVDPASRGVVRTRPRAARRRQPDRLLRDRVPGWRRALHRARRERPGAHADRRGAPGRHGDVRSFARVGAGRRRHGRAAVRGDGRRPRRRRPRDPGGAVHDPATRRPRRLGVLPSRCCPRSTSSAWARTRRCCCSSIGRSIRASATGAGA